MNNGRPALDNGFRHRARGFQRKPREVRHAGKGGKLFAGIKGGGLNTVQYHVNAGRRLAYADLAAARLRQQVG